MSVNPINAASQNLPLTSNTASSSNSTESPASQRDLFMTLLVAQLKNQDPLSPQDGTAFVAQLAQFNSLDQLVSIRTAIEALNARLGHTPTLPTVTTTTA